MTNNSDAEIADDTIVSSVMLDAPAPGLSLHEMTYRSGNLHVKGYLLVPGDGGPYPGLIYCRGGIGGFGMVRMNHAAALAAKGYAVFAPFYRGSASGEGIDKFGGDDRFDVYNAFKLMRSLPDVVTSAPIALAGFSRGAIMALLAARDCADAGPAAVWNGVSDLLLTYEERVDLRRMLKRVVGHPRKNREAYEDRSPHLWADRIRKPVLIVHGTSDDNVGVAHSRLLADALERAGAKYKLELFEGLGHLFPPEAEARAIHAIDEWFASHRAADLPQGSSTNSP